MIRKTLFGLVLGLVGAGAGVARGAYTFTTLDVSGNDTGFGTTHPTGISGGVVVGYYVPAANYFDGFQYQNGTYTKISATAAKPDATEIFGISGNTIVGFYFAPGFAAHGFVATNGVFQDLDVPGGSETQVNGVSGNTVVGGYEGTTTVGFERVGSTYTTLNPPLSAGFTMATAISGNTVVGNYQDAGGVFHGYKETGGIFTTIDVPSASGTTVSGIAGNVIVGTYSDNIGTGTHGFVMHGNSFTTIDHPLAEGGPSYVPTGTQVTGIDDVDGTTLVGTYYDGNELHGFMATLNPVPEPGTLALLGMAAVGLVRRRAR